MANKNKHNLTNQLDALSDTEYRDVLNFISYLQASRAADINNASEDDLITALQNQRENQRARQVFEWEHARRATPNAAALMRGYA